MMGAFAKLAEMEGVEAAGSCERHSVRVDYHGMRFDDCDSVGFGDGQY